MNIEQLTYDMDVEYSSLQTDQVDNVVQLIDHMNVNKDEDCLTLQQVKALARMTQRTQQQCRDVVQKGAISIFIHLLSHPNAFFVQQALYAIGNLACTHMNYRQYIIKYKGVQTLIQTTNRLSTNEKLLDLGLWTISNVCRGSQIPQYLLLKMVPGIQLICQAITKGLTYNEQTLIDCLASIQWTLAQDAKRADLLFQWGLIPYLIKFFNCENLRLQTVSLKVVGCVIKLRNHLTTNLFQNGIIQQISYQLQSSHLYIRKLVIQIFSHINSGTKTNIYELFKIPNLQQNMLWRFRNDELKVKKEICCFFANLVDMDDPSFVMEFFRKIQIASYFVQFLAQCQGENNVKLVQYIGLGLEGLYRILLFGQQNSAHIQNQFVLQITKCDGCKILTNLMSIPSENIQTTVIKIRNNFFPKPHMTSQ